MHVNGTFLDRQSSLALYQSISKVDSLHFFFVHPIPQPNPICHPHSRRPSLPTSAAFASSTPCCSAPHWPHRPLHWRSIRRRRAWRSQPRVQSRVRIKDERSEMRERKARRDAVKSRAPDPCQHQVSQSFILHPQKRKKSGSRSQRHFRVSGT